MALIQELSHAAEEDGEEEAEEAAAGEGSSSARSKAETAAQLHAESAAGAAEGVVLTETLEFLAAELIRRQELSRIQAMAVEADDVRRVRDAEEGGRRQAEDALRRKQDAVYEQLMRVHTQTAESYVDAVMDSAIDQGEPWPRNCSSSPSL